MTSRHGRIQPPRTQEKMQLVFRRTFLGLWFQLRDPIVRQIIRIRMVPIRARTGPNSHASTTSGSRKLGRRRPRSGPWRRNPRRVRIICEDRCHGFFFFYFLPNPIQSNSTASLTPSSSCDSSQLKKETKMRDTRTERKTCLYEPYAMKSRSGTE